MRKFYAELNSALTLYRTLYTSAPCEMLSTVQCRLRMSAHGFILPWWLALRFILIFVCPSACPSFRMLTKRDEDTKGLPASSRMSEQQHESSTNLHPHIPGLWPQYTDFGTKRAASNLYIAFSYRIHVREGKMKRVRRCTDNQRCQPLPIGCTASVAFEELRHTIVARLCTLSSSSLPLPPLLPLPTLAATSEEPHSKSERAFMDRVLLDQADSFRLLATCYHRAHNQVCRFESPTILDKTDSIASLLHSPRGLLHQHLYIPIFFSSPISESQIGPVPH